MVVDLVFNDMKRWLPGPNDSGANLKVLRERLRKGRKTRILLIHPESPYLEELARVSLKNLDEQRDEIELAVMRICEGMWDLALPKNGTIFEERPLQIVGNPHYNTYSMIKFDKTAWVNYYPITTRGGKDKGFFHVYGPTDDKELNILKRIEDDLSDTRAASTARFKAKHDLVQYFFDKNVAGSQK